MSISWGEFIARDRRGKETSKGSWLQTLLDPEAQTDFYHIITLRVWHGQMWSLGLQGGEKTGTSMGAGNPVLGRGALQ